MGTPLPPNEPGDACPVCWGPGKAFGDTPAPRFITAQFYDFVPGELWHPDYDVILLAPHHLTPLGAPCQWQFVASGFQWFLNFPPGFTFFIIAHIATGKLAFYQPNSSECDLTLGNSLRHGFDRIAHSGHVLLSWNEGDV